MNPNIDESIPSAEAIPTVILDELIHRFIMNTPIKERDDAVKFCINIEKAHWFYLDTFCIGNSKLKKLDFEMFSRLFFKKVSFLVPHSYRLTNILNNFKLYKNNIPTYGAILLSRNCTHVLMVNTYCAKDLWGFPKGKIEEDEDPRQCAIREVYEETGCDISNSIDPKLYIEGKWLSKMSSGFTGLFIIRNVPKEISVQPKVEREIKACSWINLDQLFEVRSDNKGSVLKLTANAFCMKEKLKNFFSKKS